MASLQSGNVSALIKITSAQGVLVVKRSVDWRQTESAAGQQTTNHFTRTRGDDLYINDAQPLFWVEQEANFSHDEIGQSDFQSVLKQFAALERNSYGVYASLHMIDAWDVRHLGPALHGKIASNCHWYIYFEREGNTWKIWRMEYVIH